MPNVGAAADDLILDSSCGEPIGTRSSVCMVDLMAGSSWLTVVSSTNDRGETFRAVRDHAKAIVEQAISRPGPIARAPETFEPPRDCAALIPATTIASLLGGSDVTVELPYPLALVTQATFVTENTACQWYRDGGDRAAELHVYPGGAWAAELTLPTLDADEVALEGLLEGERALSSCYDVSAYGFWFCSVNVAADGTWVRGIGTASDAATATAIGVAIVEATLAHRR